MDNEARKKFAEVVAKAWVDPSFKERLLQSPSEVLEQHDITLPAGVEAKILEDTDTVKYFVLPTQPEDENSLTAVDGIHNCPVE